MNIEFYNLFVKYKEMGLKKQARDSVRAFVLSFENHDEVQKWVWSYLPQLEADEFGRIRHEIFIGLIYPVIKRGYLANEFESTLWLGKLILNVYRNRIVHKELDYVTDTLLYKKCYEQNPDSGEVRHLLLDNIIQGFRYCIHEWPMGMLYGSDCATSEECLELRIEVELAKKLDLGNKYFSFLEDFSDKLNQYESSFIKQGM